MPVVGLVADLDWRYALAAPLVPCLVALVAAGRRPADPRRPSVVGVHRILRSDGVARWAAAEVLTYTAWCGTLVYAGALLVGSYGCSRTVVGLTLAACGAAYIPGTLLARRVASGRPRRWVLALTLAAAPVLVLLGTVRPSLAVSGALLALLSFLIGARTMAASAMGLSVGRESPIMAMGLRTAAVQGGYLLGGALGGLAILAGGPASAAVILGGLLVGAAWVHARPAPSAARPPEPARTGAGPGRADAAPAGPSPRAGTMPPTR
jgi:predicted MFS family arabinose efflux permease